MGYVIEFPKCAFCDRGGALNIWRCRSCKLWTCDDCFIGFNSSDRCTHQRYEPVQGDNWILE